MPLRPAALRERLRAAGPRASPDPSRVRLLGRGGMEEKLRSMLGRGLKLVDYRAGRKDTQGGQIEVALFGGSFNPPTVGHLLAAHYVHATQAVDEVWLLPAHQHPFKKDLVEFEHRVAMCERMCDEASGWLKVSAIESELDGEGRTVDTLEALVARYPGYTFSLVIGSDLVAELPKWKNVERIQELAKVIVLSRPGHPVAGAIDWPLKLDVSSTQVREKLSVGQDASALSPRQVLEYAAEHSLYER